MGDKDSNFGEGANAMVVRGMRGTAMVAASACIGAPLLVLIGWITGSGVLKRMNPGWVAMNPMTAVGFILCGVALWAELADRGRLLARVACAGPMCIGGLKLISLFVAHDGRWNVDRVLFRQSLLAEPGRPNFMAPNTAMALLMAGTAALLLHLRRSRGKTFATHVLAIGVGSIGLLAIVGYVYHSYSLYGIGSFFPMAVHTAGLFTLLALGILFARPDKGVMAVVSSDLPAGALARRLLPLAIVLPAAIGGMRLVGVRAGWFSGEFGFTLVVLANIVVFASLLWWELALLRRADVRRAQTERQLRDAYALLTETAKSEKQAHETLKQTHSQLVQAEKLAGLGQMVAGVAHEINNPLAFVSNNVAVLQRETAALLELLGMHAELSRAPIGERAEFEQRIAEAAEKMDLPYVTANLPELIARSREGLRRIQQIVRDLKDFARLDEGAVQEADLNAGVRSTVNIIEGQAKKKGVRIELRLGGLPAVRCHAAKLNQVVMNLLSNAIDASPEGGVITVTTGTDDGAVTIAVEDQGTGVPVEIRGRIFDPFFTTKPVGKGTGLGLSISYGIVKDHGGEIVVDGEAGKGARFVVKVPRDREQARRLHERG